MKFLRTKLSQYFPKPFKSFWGNTNVKLIFSTYTTKTGLKNNAHVDTSSFAIKTNLASIKTDVISQCYELVTVPVDLSKFSNAAKNEVVKKMCTVYDKLATKVNNIDTSEFVLKTKYDKDKLEFEKKIPDVSNLVKKLIIMLKLVKQKIK